MKRIRVYIDGENISAKKYAMIHRVVQRISKQHMDAKIDSVKVFRMREDHTTERWDEQAKCSPELKIVGLIGDRYKNKVDYAIWNTIANEINTDSGGRLDTIVLVSSDGDFAEMVRSFRKDNGKRVIVIGKQDSSHQLRKSCDQFYSLQ
jgi:uncharacterized LabA/DUF88 family protein